MFLISTREVFQVKIEEIEAHFRILKYLESNTIDRPYLSKSNNSKIILDNNVNQIYKSVAVILLYNLIESTVKSSFKALFDEMTSQCLKCGDYSEEIIKVWVRHKLLAIKNNSVSSSYDKIDSILLDVLGNIEIVFDDDVFEYSGNIDYRKVKNNCDKISLNHSNQHVKKASGSIKDIKDIRNQLSHGEFSFAEKGRNYSYSDIEKMKKDTYKYLKWLMKDIEKFITDRGYLKIA